MDQMHASEEDLVLHYYGELTAADDARTSAHIGECQACHQAYRRLQQVLVTVDEAAVAGPDLPEGFERTVWARLEPSLDRRHRGWLARLFPSPANLAWATAALLIAAGAFYAGRLSPRTPQVSPEIAASTPAQVRERILLVDLGDHLDRSQRVLVELVSAEGDGRANPGERARAEQLVAANRLYRATATSTGDTAVVDLLDQLERVLVEVAASPSDLSSGEMDDIRQRIESGSLLFKVRVVSSELQERRKTALRPTGQRSSL
jgi:hypothetical protein